MTHKSVIMPATSPLFCNPPILQNTTANIDATFYKQIVSCWHQVFVNS